MWRFIVLLIRYAKYRKRVKIDFNARLAGDHLYGKWLLTWLLLVMSLMVSFVFVLSFFSLEMSWMRSGTELSQFLRNFLPAQTT